MLWYILYLYKYENQLFFLVSYTSVVKKVLNAEGLKLINAQRLQ